MQKMRELRMPTITSSAEWKSVARGMGTVKAAVGLYPPPIPGVLISTTINKKIYTVSEKRLVLPANERLSFLRY